MKKEKIISVLIAAATTISALTLTASAGWIHEGDTPLIDVTPSVNKKIVRDGGTYLIDNNGDRISGIAYGDFRYRDEFRYDMRMAEFDENGDFDRFYNGFTKDKYGKRYYAEGIRAYGWRKIGGNWYHFDRETGYMDTGRVKICDVSYVFDKSGKWTGKVGKNGLCPEDFSIGIQSNLGGAGFSSDNTICYGETTENEMYSVDIKISKRDRQALYCMLLESNAIDNSVKNIDNKYFNKRISEYVTDEISTEETISPRVYTINTIVDGKSYEFKFDLDAYQIIHFDQDALDVSFLYESVQSFHNWLYERNKPDTSVELIMYD